MGDSEKMSDRAAVWEQMAREHPEFKEIHDPANNHHAVREIVLGGSLSWAGVWRRFNPKGKRVMDIGANTGIFSTYCALNGAAIVLAFEPFVRPYHLFSKMLKETGLCLHVAAVPIAVWTFDGDIPYVGNVSKLEECNAFNGGVPSDGITENFSKAEKVPCITLAAAIGDQEWDCVKMDIEGAEFEVILATPEEALKKIKFMYVEFHPWASQYLYGQTWIKLKRIFNVEGICLNDNGRWEAAYCTR